MAKTPIDEAPAGPAMDAAVAEAMGLAVEWRQWADGIQPVYFAGTYAARDDGWAEHEDWRRVLPYSTDIGAAWKLVEKMQESLSGPWEAFSSELCGNARLLRGKAHGDAPLFVCRAFLKASGVTHVEIPDDDA